MISRLQYIGQNMLIHIGLAFPVNPAQFFHFGIQHEKFFGDVLIIGEKMPHLIRQFKVNGPFLWKPVAGLVLFLPEYMKINSHIDTIIFYMNSESAPGV